MKKILILLALILILSACGTSGNNQANSGSGENQNQNQSESAGANSALPDNFPDKSVDVLVGFAAGGGSDIAARTFTSAMSQNKIVDQKFVVHNIPGAQGALALRELHKRSGDPYVLLSMPEYADGLWDGTLADLQLSDFNPVAQVATDYLVLVVRADSPYQTAIEVLDKIKEDPGSVVIPLAGPMKSGEGLKWYELANKYGLNLDEMVFVPHDGANPALTSLLSGDGDVAFTTISIADDHILSGSLRVLAVMTEKRIEDRESLKDAPTMIEQGVDITAYRPRGFWLPGGVSEEVVEFWENAFKQILDTLEYKEYVQKAGLLAEFRPKEEYIKYIQDTGSLYSEYVKTLDE